MAILYIERETNISNKLECLKIPTGRRQTSWLFTQHSRGVELEATKNKSDEWRGGGPEPGTSRLHVQHPKPLYHPQQFLVYLTVSGKDCSLIYTFRPCAINCKPPFSTNRKQVLGVSSVNDRKKLIFFNLDSSWKQPYSWFVNSGKGHCIVFQGKTLNLCNDSGKLSGKAKKMTGEGGVVGVTCNKLTSYILGQAFLQIPPQVRN